MRLLIITGLLVSALMASQPAICANTVVVVPLCKPKAAGPGSIAGSLGMNFSYIPAGTFLMGSPASEPGRDTDETLHSVTLTQPFYLQMTEVTNKQWNGVIVAQGLGVNPSSSHTGDTYPVDSVNWYEAILFANTLSVMEGRSQCYNTHSSCSGIIGEELITGNAYQCTTVDYVPDCTGYHLPTEAQWEYGARAGTSTPWHYLISYDSSPSGSALLGYNSNLEPVGWYSFNNTPPGTKPVAWKTRNTWYIFDMLGNVWEWVQDWYDSNYYTMAGADIDPLGPVTTFKVIRGGGYSNDPDYVRIAKRYGLGPAGRGDFLGFRLAMSAD